MIMKANKQIGFIYKDNESIDKILKDGDVVFERGFLREKTSTTLPITFGGVGKDLKDYRVYGNTVQKILPDEYTQVEYIKNTGLQYIDTGVYGNLNTEIRVKASSNGESAQLFGDITTQSKAISCNFGFAQAIGSRFGNKNVAVILGNYITTDIPFELIENKNGMYIDNVEVIAFDTTDEFTTTNTLLLLNRNSSSGATANRGFGNLYNCEIYDGNTLIRNFIPCYRNSDNEVGLYDLVNNVFYTNQGTGVFTYGSVAPTPDAPIEMVSCGDRAKNLCFTNFDNWEIGQYSTDGNKNFASGRIRLKELLKIETGKQYYFNTFSEFKFILRTYDENKDFISSFGTIENGNTLTPQTAKYLGITIYNPNDSSLVYSDYETLFENGTIRPLICLNSETDKSYEPYGYKIPINVRSDNLFDISEITSVANGTLSNNIITTKTSGSVANFNVAPIFPQKKLLSGHTYYLSADIRKKSGAGNFRKINDYVADWTSLISPTISDVFQKYVFTKTFTTDTAYYRFLFQFGNTNNAVFEIKNIKLSEVNEDYQPYYNETTNIYLDEPLRKTKDGTYVDYIDFINQKVYRQLGETEISDYSGFSHNGNFTKNVQFTTTAINNLKLNIVNSAESSNLIFCNYISSFEGTTASSSKIRLNIPYEYLGITSSSTSSEAKQALINLMSGKTMEFVYPLETPTEESITLPNIPTIDENNTLNIETEITPSQVYIKYKSNE